MRTRGMGKPMLNDPCGECKDVRMKRMGASGMDGTRALPRRKRRTIPHQKGTSFPGMWMKGR